MDSQHIVDGLLLYVGLVVLLTFHEFAHAWTAWRCGDDTAKLQGRLSLNPIVHIDPIGTVVLPLLMIFLPPAYAGFLLGWAKPVPVNPSNLHNPRRDDILISMAGPAMNLFLAIVLVGIARVLLQFVGKVPAIFCMEWARVSLLLCFFNLIPIPPLDGSHVLRVLIRMSYETYYQIARFGFIIIIVVLQIPLVSNALALVTRQSMLMIASWFGLAN